MQLALRPNAPTSANLFDRLFSRLIKARLVTDYPHAGIAINGRMYHANGRKGLHSSTYDPALWVLIDLGTERDRRVLDLFEIRRGVKYDWFSLLAFVGLKARHSERYYCYEWCYQAITGKHPTERVTPETLLMLTKGEPWK